MDFPSKALEPKEVTSFLNKIRRLSKECPECGSKMKATGPDTFICNKCGHEE